MNTLKSSNELNVRITDMQSVYDAIDLLHTKVIDNMSDDNSNIVCPILEEAMYAIDKHV